MNLHVTVHRNTAEDLVMTGRISNQIAPKSIVKSPRFEPQLKCQDSLANFDVGMPTLFMSRFGARGVFFYVFSYICDRH